MFKFVQDNVNGVGTKRKLGAGPCDTCKRRHKRCSHNEAHRMSSSPESPSDRPLPSISETSAEGPGLISRTISQENFSQHRDTQPFARQTQPPTNDAHVRFVADLSPESAFIINAKHPLGDGNISKHGVGLWLGQEHEARPSELAPEDETRVTVVPAEVLDGSAGQLLLLSTLRPALRRECMATLPADCQVAVLMDLYYEKIDPIFPLLSQEPWEKHGTMETIALKQCICLVASLDPIMAPHLRLPHTDQVLPQQEFRARIAAAVKQALDLGFITDEIVLMQVCTLMSMYVEKQGFGELSTYYCAQAILHEQTLGFHVGWPDGKAGGERSRRLFWCIWVLDRLNAATNGRPTVIHRSDMDRKVIESVEDQPPPFKLLIRIAQFLDHTISLYRPGTMLQDQSGKVDDTFEGLVEASGAQNLGNGMLASLELFYLSVVIIRGRSAGHRPSSELQWFCATRIVAVASGEFKSCLVFWPVLPYSVTVAASAAYRSLRNSPMPYTRRRAYKLFQDSCEVLEDLSKAFFSARAMARLAMDTMQEVERVAAERTRRASIRIMDGAGTPTIEENTISHTQHSQTSETMDQAQQQHQHQLPGLPSQPLGPDAASHMPPGLAGPSHQLDANFFGGFDGEAGIFGNFDPNFDLGRIDAIFSANLDPSAPPFMERWA
ncbi:hypothetical protein S40293_10102 [Stachybotrys chartarum IBT 40293]|nr:hypothetical protein S40293_10102 [Stachybotrys chartarum IBT 40293]